MFEARWNEERRRFYRRGLIVGFLAGLSTAIPFAMFAAELLQ